MALHHDLDTRGIVPSDQYLGADQALIDAMQFLIANEQNPKQYLEATFDLPFASKKWQRTVLVKRKGKLWFARHHLETCVFSYLAGVTLRKLSPGAE